LHYKTPHEVTDHQPWLIQSSPFWGSHSADAMESKLLRYRQRQRGMFIMICIRLATILAYYLRYWTLPSNNWFYSVISCRKVRLIFV